MFNTKTSINFRIPFCNSECSNPISSLVSEASERINRFGISCLLHQIGVACCNFKSNLSCDEMILYYILIDIPEKWLTIS
ncbi:unnamed protein product [Moneuplotes crassus]|uniref:Uncharacterized protein n=1 Tax=Euplotes crassus TaxID=5936 RepID=A0AAD1XM86_EUPCR|nr:unnamed protein product [Moneuplotes crassus]